MYVKLLVRELGRNKKFGNLHAVIKFLNTLYKSTGMGIWTGFSWQRTGFPKVYCEYGNEILGPKRIEESLDQLKKKKAAPKVVFFLELPIFV